MRAPIARAAFDESDAGHVRSGAFDGHPSVRNDGGGGGEKRGRRRVSRHDEVRADKRRALHPDPIAISQNSDAEGRQHPLGVVSGQTTARSPRSPRRRPIRPEEAPSSPERSPRSGQTTGRRALFRARSPAACPWASSSMRAPIFPRGSDTRFIGRRDNEGSPWTRASSPSIGASKPHQQPWRWCRCCRSRGRPSSLNPAAPGLSRTSVSPSSRTVTPRRRAHSSDIRTSSPRRIPSMRVVPCAKRAEQDRAVADALVAGDGQRTGKTGRTGNDGSHAGNHNSDAGLRHHGPSAQPCKWVGPTRFV